MNVIERGARWGDGFQQRHKRLAIMVAVLKKFGDDRGGSLAALVAFYAFLSLFPLLLVLVTVSGYVLRGNPSLEHDIVNSALRQFPIVGVELGKSIHPLRGSIPGLVIGLLGLLWGSLGVAGAAQHAMAEVWNVPGKERPGLVARVAHGFALIGVLGLGLLATTLVSAHAVFRGNAAPTSVVSLIGSTALNAALFVAAFRLLTPTKVAVRDLIPGAVVAGVAWTVLQALGGFLVDRQLRHSSQVYGFFAIVLGLVSWLYLGAQVVLYAAEFNVVRARRLWPRSLVQPPLTGSDRQVLRDLAEQEARRPEEIVDVRFIDDTGERDDRGEL